jgi:RNA polymerase sigma factor (sigma-70 family)
LVRQSLAGKRDAFGKIVVRYQALICSIAYSGTGSLSESEDVAQETFMTAWRKLATLREPAKLRSWLCRIARNLVYQSRQRQQRQPIFAAEQLEAASAAHSAEPSPQEWAISKEEEAILWRSVQQIPEMYREPLILFYREHQSIQTVARNLELTEDAVRQRLSRGRKMLNEQVLSFVECALEHTTPSKTFTAGVIVALPALTISSKAALLAETAHSAYATTANKIIAMTTFSKAVIVATLVLAGVGIYQARQAVVARNEVQSLRQQLAGAARPSTSGTRAASVRPRPVRPTTAMPHAVQTWAGTLLALNTNGWEMASGVAMGLAAVDPDEGLAALIGNWHSITNAKARLQLLQGFYFAKHKWLPAVLDLALPDSSPEVQKLALSGLGEIALQDFGTNSAAALDWLSSRRNASLSEAFADGLAHAVDVLSGSDVNQVRTQLGSLRCGSRLFRDFPEALASSGLDQVLAKLAGGADQDTARLTLKAVSESDAPLPVEWRRDVSLPLLAPEYSVGVRYYAAKVLEQGPEVRDREWAVQPLLNALTDIAYSTGERPLSGFTDSIAAIGSPRAIPTMIALMEADNNPEDTICLSVGLGRLAGVDYVDTHNSAWWRQWWNDNKQRFPADVQALEIPSLKAITVSGVSP